MEIFKVGVAGVGSKLTVDEAIEHCLDVIKKNDDCKECIQEHAMLLVWLEELKELRKFKHDVARAFTPR